MMRIKATFFGKTKWVDAVPFNMQETETYDEILWIENSNDEYGLETYRKEGKKLALVYREDWIKGQVCD